MKDSQMEDHLRRANEIVAPTGWREVNLDLPLWRYGLLAVCVAGGYLGLAFMAGGWSVDHMTPGVWAIGAAIIAACLLPALLRRLYVRRKSRG